MLKKFFKYLPQILAMLFLAGFVAYAWTEPSSIPPGGNVPAPVNVGSASQYKSGALGIGGVLRGYANAIFDGWVGIGTADPQGILDVGGGKFVVTNEILASSAFTAGPNSPSSGVDDSSFGFAPWASPASVVTSNNNWATAVIKSISPATHYLKATGFGFTIPANAIIDGIKAEVERSGSAGYVYPKNAPYDASVYLLKNGSVIGQNGASSAPWPEQDAGQTYGSPSAKWGGTWTPADINASNFGIVIAATGVIDDPDTDQTSVSIDHISITIYYRIPSSARDVAKVSNVTIAGDGSISTNLNADKLDGLDSTELGKRGLYGYCDTQLGTIPLLPALRVGQGGCACLSGYQAVVTGGNVAVQYWTCYKN